MEYTGHVTEKENAIERNPSWARIRKRDPNPKNHRGIQIQKTGEGSRLGIDKGFKPR